MLSFFDFLEFAILEFKDSGRGLLDEGEEGGGDGGGEAEELAGDGVDEHQRAGMEGQTVDGRGFGAIAAVAGDGVAEVVHVHTDLVFAPCLKLYFDEGVAVGRFDGFVAGEGKLAFVGVLR